MPGYEENSGHQECQAQPVRPDPVTLSFNLRALIFELQKPSSSHMSHRATSYRLCSCGISCKLARRKDAMTQSNARIPECAFLAHLRNIEPLRFSSNLVSGGSNTRQITFYFFLFTFYFILTPLSFSFPVPPPDHSGSVLSPQEGLRDGIAGRRLRSGNVHRYRFRLRGWFPQPPRPPSGQSF